MTKKEFTLNEEKMMRLIRLCIGKEKFCQIDNVVTDLAISKEDAWTAVKSLQDSNKIKLKGFGKDKCVYLT